MQALRESDRREEQARVGIDCLRRHPLPSPFSVPTLEIVAIGMATKRNFTTMRVLAGGEMSMLARVFGIGCAFALERGRATPGHLLVGWKRQCLSEIGIETLVRSVGKRP